MSAITDTDRLTTLFKRAQGFTNLNTNYALNQETVVSRPAVLADRVFTDTVPAVPPTDFGPMPVNLVGGGTKQASSAYPWLVQYSNVPLISQAENPNKTFSTSVGGVNLLTNILLPRVSDATPLETTYAITVTGSYPISQANYILDRDAGRIMIFDGPVNSGSVTPTISFWRYEGTTLADGGGGGGGVTSVTPGSSGNITVTGTSNVTVDLEDNVVISDTGSFTINSGNMLMVAQEPKGAIIEYENSSGSTIGGISMNTTGTLELGGNNIQLSTAPINSTLNPRVFINTAGNVGIGTITPGVKLDVAGRTNITLNGGDSALVTTNTDPTGAALKCEMSGANVLVTKDASSNAVIKNTSGTGLVFGVSSDSGIERMRIASNGRVGIGTTTPTAALDVSGTSWTSGSVVINKTTTGDDTTMHQLQFMRGREGTTLVAGDELGRINFLPKNASGVPNFAAVSLRAFAEGDASGSVCPAYFTISNVSSKFDSTNYERMRISANGNVGIGTSTPVRTLDVSGWGMRVRAVGTSASNIGYDILGRADTLILDSGVAGYSGGAASILFKTADDTRQIARIAAVDTGTGTGDWNGELLFQTTYSGSNIERMRINSSGYVGIGTNNPQYTLDVIGSIRATGSIIPTSYQSGQFINEVVFNPVNLGLTSGGSPITMIGRRGQTTTYYDIPGLNNITYTPKISTSDLIITLSCPCQFNGSGLDLITLSMRINGSHVAWTFQGTNIPVGSVTPQGDILGRSTALLPITAKYKNTSTSPITISFGVDSGQTDDALYIQYELFSTPSLTLIIREIAR